MHAAASTKNETRGHPEGIRQEMTLNIQPQ